MGPKPPPLQLAGNSIVIKQRVALGRYLVIGLCILVSGILHSFFFTYFIIPSANLKIIEPVNAFILFNQRSTHTNTSLIFSTKFEQKSTRVVDRGKQKNARQDTQFTSLPEKKAPHSGAPYDVFRNAAPVGEWIINLEKWPPGTHITAEFEVWVSEAGKIEKWNLVGSSAGIEEYIGAFEFLGDTPMNPALFHSIPIASHTTFEIDIQLD